MKSPEPASSRGDGDSPGTVSPRAEGVLDAAQQEWLEQALPQFNRYALVGQGGMGEVYQACQKSLDRTVAIKLLRLKTADNPMFADRFRQEAVVLARLNHPYIVSVFEFGEASGRPYLVMEFVDGTTLRQLISAGALAPRRALLIAWMICTALRYAHEQGVAHRDIKPENILIDEHQLDLHDSSHASLTTSLQGAIKITDFGLARMLEESSDAARLTQAGYVLGTPYYMAPEQRCDAVNVDHRADIYAVGVLLYEMLTGILPQGRVRPPSEIADVDRMVDRIVFRCIDAEPGNRYQSVSDLIGDLERVPTFVIAVRPQRRRRQFGWIACGVLALLVVAGLWFNRNTGVDSASTGSPPPDQLATGALAALDRSADHALHTDATGGESVVQPNASTVGSRSPAPTFSLDSSDDLFVVEQFGSHMIPFELLISNDSVPDNRPVGVVMIEEPGFGTIESSRRGLRYSPNGFFTGWDRLVYQPVLGDHKGPPATVQIFVTSRVQYEVSAGTILHAKPVSLFADRDDAAFLISPGSAAAPIDPGHPDFQDPIDGSAGPEWKYYDRASAPHSDWMMPEYDDSDWDSGHAEFGYSTSRNDAPVRTEIGKNGITAFFRQKFDVADPSQVTYLQGHLLRDDGAAVYLNGVEVERQRLMAGATPGLRASKTHEDWFEESIYFPFMVDQHLLRPGPNVLAVEVHQHLSRSSDCSFDFALMTSPPGLLADADGRVQCEPVEQPRHGRLELNSDGTFQYEPHSEFIGTDRFTFRVDDGREKSNEVPVEIRVFGDATVHVNWLSADIGDTALDRNSGSEGEQQTFFTVAADKSDRGERPVWGAFRFFRSGDISNELTVRYALQSDLDPDVNIKDYETSYPDRFERRIDDCKRSPLGGWLTIPAGRSVFDLPILPRDEELPRDKSIAIRLLPSPFYRIEAESATATGWSANGQQDSID